MSYVTYPHFCRADAEFGLSTTEPVRSVRSVTPAIRDALRLIGGGVLFAVNLYMMIVLVGAL